MKPDEFIKTIKDFSTLPEQTKYDLLVLYWISFLKNPFFVPQLILNLASDVRLSTFVSFPQYVSKYSKKRKDDKQKFIKLSKGYTIERQYEFELQLKYLKRKESINLSNELKKLHSSITDPDLSEYLLEAINCFEHDLLRASIVMTWCWVYYLLRDWIFKKHLTAFNAKSNTWKNPITVYIIEDFENINEANVIDTCKSIGLISKELHKTLKMHLDTRNSFAHPSNKPSSLSIAEAYIVTAIKEILPKLK